MKIFKTKIKATQSVIFIGIYLEGGIMFGFLSQDTSTPFKIVFYGTDHDFETSERENGRHVQLFVICLRIDKDMLHSVLNVLHFATMPQMNF